MGHKNVYFPNFRLLKPKWREFVKWRCEQDARNVDIQVKDSQINIIGLT